jgi:hypothetical protein
MKIPLHNTSGFKGVSAARSGKWRAYIKKNGKQICLGVFLTKEQAAFSYNNAAREIHGDFASLNIVGVQQ